MPPYEYLAGFFDADGCVLIQEYKRSKRKRPEFRAVVTVSQKYDLRVLHLYKEHFGGSIHQNRATKHWYWVISGRQVEKFLNALLPYLLGKRDQAELVLAFLETSKGNTCRPLPPEMLEQRRKWIAELTKLKREVKE